MNAITTVKDLKDALAAYSDDFQVIGILQGSNGSHVRTLFVEQAKGRIGDEPEFYMPLVHVVLDKNAVIGLSNNNQQIILQKVEH